jgi:hypothetical protein
MVDGTIEDARQDDRTKVRAEALAAAKAKLEGATMWLMQNGMANPDNAGAGATAYLRLSSNASCRTPMASPPVSKPAPKR